jgi:hypothetical protein
VQSPGLQALSLVFLGVKGSQIPNGYTKAWHGKVLNAFFQNLHQLSRIENLIKGVYLLWKYNFMIKRKKRNLLACKSVYTEVHSPHIHKTTQT